MKRRIAEFSIVVYNNDGQVEVAFMKAKKVPKAYDSFVACLELGCLNTVQKIMKGIDNGTPDTKTDSKGDNANNSGNAS